MISSWFFVLFGTPMFLSWFKPGMIIDDILLFWNQRPFEQEWTINLINILCSVGCYPCGTSIPHPFLYPNRKKKQSPIFSNFYWPMHHSSHLHLHPAFKSDDFCVFSLFCSMFLRCANTYRIAKLSQSNWLQPKLYFFNFAPNGSHDYLANVFTHFLLF